MKIKDVEKAAELLYEYNRYTAILEDVKNAKSVKNVNIIDSATRRITEIKATFEDEILSNSILASLSAYYQNKVNKIAQELKKMGVDM